MTARVGANHAPGTLAAWLATSGASQNRLAERASLQPSTVCRVLHGETPCSLLVALALDKATDGAIRAEAMVPQHADLILHLRGIGTEGQP